MPRLLGVTPTESHFVDIYNRNGVWSGLKDQNLLLFEAFADIHRCYRWSVHVQTVDDRTLTDHRIEFLDSLDGIDLTKRDGQALLLLLLKLKLKLKQSMSHSPEELILHLDEGVGKAGAPFARAVFREWGERYNGRIATSAAEPLIQIADFLAFVINRSTHLQIKGGRTETDLWFLSLVGRMEIQSPDIKQTSFQ